MKIRYILRLFHRTMPHQLKTETSPWTLYIVRCSDSTLYCGITNDLERRIRQHNEGRGARYTSGRRPVKVLKSWQCPSHSEALRSEAAFKKLSRTAKLNALHSPSPPPLQSRQQSSNSSPRSAQS